MEEPQFYIPELTDDENEAMGRNRLAYNHAVAENPGGLNAMTEWRVSRHDYELIVSANQKLPFKSNHPAWPAMFKSTPLIVEETA